MAAIIAVADAVAVDGELDRRTAGPGSPGRLLFGGRRILWPCAGATGCSGDGSIHGAAGPASLDPSQSARARSSNERTDPALQHAAIRWAGADLLIDLERVPVRQAIQMLAAETQTSVRGGEHIGARLVTFKWQGRDVQAAWHQLLGPLSGFSLACASGSCQMLIDGPAAAAVTLAGAARAPHGAAAGAESPPDGAEEPITTDE